MKNYQYIPIQPTPELMVGLLFKLLLESGRKIDVSAENLREILQKNYKVKIMVAAKKDENFDVIYDEKGQPEIDESMKMEVRLVEETSVNVPVEKKFPGVPSILVH